MSAGPGGPARAWLVLAGLLAAGSLLGFVLPAPVLDWQPELAARQPWRCWTAAFVHWSHLHLAANLAGLVLVAALGWAAQAPRALALAWAAAWPLGHAALALQPALAHYGGLSGVLHAGVAAVALWLLLSGRGRRRGIGAALLGGLLIKLLLERPWAGVLQQPAGWDIAVAPLAHVTGAAAGLLCTGVWLWRRRAVDGSAARR